MANVVALAFVESRVWRGARGRFLPPLEERDLPHSRLARFGGEATARALRVLEFLAPLTTTSPDANARGFGRVLNDPQKMRSAQA